MPIIFRCAGCGFEFHAPDHLAGQQAQCNSCGMIVTVPSISPGPSATTPTPPVTRLQSGELPNSMDSPTGSPVAQPDYGEDWLQRDRQRGVPMASNPGRVRLNIWRFFVSFPTWPAMWMGSSLVTLILTIWIHWAFGIMFVATVALHIYYWRIQIRHCVIGNANPAIVVSVHPPLLAVVTDLSTGDGDFGIVHISEQPLSRMTGGPPKIGARHTAITTYGQLYEDQHHADITPIVTNCITSNVSDIQRLEQTIDETGWKEVEQAIRLAPQPLEAGMYPFYSIERWQSAPPNCSPDAIVKLVNEHFTPVDADFCELACNGINPDVLRKANATYCGNSALSTTIAILHPQQFDHSGEFGMLFTAERVFYSFADIGTGHFAWTDVLGAIEMCYIFEITLRSGARIRAKNLRMIWSRELESLLNRVATSAMYA